MTAATFDALAYFEQLKAAGVPEAQAKVQAEAMRSQAEAQAASLRSAFREYDEARQKELATKGDINELRLEIEKTRYALLKWQIGGWIALAAIMARGFGWLGF